MISIIIPTYNRGHLIERAIQSVINQSYKDWELIIIDDGSEDNTSEILKSYLKNPKITYHFTLNSGAADCRNFGVAQAKYDYIIFLDSDDEAEINWLESFRAEIHKGAEVVCCGFCVYDKNGAVVKRIIPSSLKFFPDQTGRFTNGGSFLLKKSLFNKAGGYDVELKSGQHTEFSVRLIPILIENKMRIHNVYKPLLKIHIHDGDRIRDNFQYKYLGSKRILEVHQNTFFSRKKLRSSYEAVVAYNALRIGKKDEAVLFAKKSFLSNPSFKGLLRVLKYSITISLFILSFP